MGNKDMTLKDLITNGAMSKNDDETIVNAVKNRKNILILGQCATGKTTLMRAIYHEVKKIFNLAVLNSNMEIEGGNGNEGIFVVRSHPNEKIIDEFINYVEKNNSYVLMDELESILSRSNAHVQKINNMVRNKNCIVTFQDYKFNNSNKRESGYFDLIVETSRYFNGSFKIKVETRKHENLLINDEVIQNIISLE